MFSIFHIHDGGAARLTRCDLRAGRGMCTSTREEARAAATAAPAAAAPSPSSDVSLSPSPTASVGGRVDGALLLAADPSAKFRRVEHGDVVIEQAIMNPLALFGHERPPVSAAAAAPSSRLQQRSLPRKLSFASPSSASPSSASPASSSARLVIKDTALWCPETGFIRAGRPSAPGEGHVSVSSRVWTPLELASALGSAGSRTVLCEDDLVLPRAGHGRPSALVQDRDVVFRAAADASGDGGGVSDGGAPRRPVRLSCLHEPGARDCVFPVVAAGPGSSVSFEGLSIDAPDPGCPVQPATRCSYRGRDLPHSLQGTLVPAGAAGVSSGGWLVLSGVDLAYDFCTSEFESAVDAVVEAAAAAGTGAAADGVTLVRAGGGGGGAGGNCSSSSFPPPPRITFSCAHCDFNCSLPGSGERGEQPSAFSLWNTTISCARPLPAALRKRAGTGVVRVGKGGGDSGGGNALASSAFAAASSGSTAPPSFRASNRLSTAALAGTLAAGDAAVAAAVLGAALGARTVARRAAAAGAGAGGGSENEHIRVSSSSSPSPPPPPLSSGNDANISAQR